VEEKVLKKLYLFLPILCGFISTILLIYISFQKKIIKDSNGRLQKFKKYYQLYNVWIKNKSNGLSISKNLLEKGYNKIAVYGNGEIGCRLYEELKGTEVQVAFFIDKIANDMKMLHDESVPIIGIADIKKNSDIDAVVITTINIFDEIEVSLAAVSNCNIISIEEIL
jgi:hypothetical protein